VGDGGDGVAFGEEDEGSAGGLFAPLIGAVVDMTSLRTGLALLVVFVAAAWLISLRLVFRSTGLSQGG
jgi:MFS transporter, FSR family, fosmidomycin resistance protein